MSRRRGRSRDGRITPSQHDRWLRDPHTQKMLRHRRLRKRRGVLDKGAMKEHERKYGDWAPPMKDGKSARAFVTRRKAAQDEFGRMDRAGTLPAMFSGTNPDGSRKDISTAARREAFIRTSLMKGNVNEATKGWVTPKGWEGTDRVERGITQADSAITPYTTKVFGVTVPSAVLMGGSAKPITPEEMEAEHQLKEEISKEKLAEARARYQREQREKRRAAESAALFEQQGIGQSGGFVPNFSAAAMELNNSYSRAGTRVVGLKGIGLANTEETLGHHPRFTQPFVNPPEGSREGMLHKMRSISRTGVNPYMIPNTSLSSQGSIPEIDTSGAQSSLGALTQEFDNLKIALAQGGFIPNASGSGTSTVTNNMSVYSNSGIPVGGPAVNSDLEGQMKTLMDTVKRGLPDEYARASMPARKI